MPIDQEVLLTKFVEPTKENSSRKQITTPYPLWDPLSAKGKIVTRPPYIISFTPYTTPTPLPKRPDWKKDDWLAYFKENHPNFWFQKQLQMKAAQKLQNETAAEAKKNSTNSTEFDYANWKSWSPETWLQWSNSKEYKEKYLNVLNPYRKEQPFQTYEDINSASLDYRDNQPVYLSESYVGKIVQAQVEQDDALGEEATDTMSNEALHHDRKNSSKLPPRTYFPPPTYSPTKDPFYLHNNDKAITKMGIQGISNEYIYTTSHLSSPSSISKAGASARARKVEDIQDRQLSYDQGASSSPVKAVNPVDLLLKTGDDTRVDALFNDEQSANDQEFTIPYSNYIKNLISKSGQPLLEPVSQQQYQQSSQPGRTRPPIIRIGDAQTYDYSSKRGEEQQQPEVIRVEDNAGGGSTSSSSSRTPAGFASSSAAAAGPGASTSTSTRSGIPQKIEETPNDNTYYPCLDNSCAPVTNQDEFEADYQDEDEQLLAELFGPDTPPQVTELDGDAITLQVPKAGPGSGTTDPNPPVFKQCTTLEECLGKPIQPDYDTFLTPLEYEEYQYDDLTVQQPQDELQWGSISRPAAALSNPQDSIVTRPIFTPDGTLLFEAEQSPTEAKLDRLIDSLGSLISLLNTTKGNNDVLSDQQSVQSNVNVPPPAGFGAGQMGTLNVQSNGTASLQQIAEESLLMNAISHHLGDAPLDGSAFFNLKSPLEIVQEGGKLKTTIPPHLIPLGPEGTPLLNPDGSPTNNLVLTDHSITDIFPFLSQDQQHLHQIPLVNLAQNITEADNRDFFTKSVNMVRELPMDTRRRMLAGMMMGVPMAALTMATLGAPTVAIAPMALAIPGFLFAAFTETNPNHNSRQGQQGQHHHAPRRGISGLIDAVRDFRRSQNNATLAAPASSSTDTEHHHHHFFG